MAKIGGVQEVRRELLRPYENNAKIHSQSQVKQIAESIKEFGFLSPCLIDKDYNIIRGHGRVMAREMLGMESVPCVFIEGLTETQRKAYILADNRLTELANWDEEILNLELQELADVDFEIDLTGFSYDVKNDSWFNERQRYDNDLENETEEYQEFVEKFEPKKTTDDCYTPDEIYEVVASWVEEKYGYKRERFIRPFYPNGDYQKENYPVGSVVVDNPPFSIMSEILRFYNDNGIKYFLFAPSLVGFSDTQVNQSTMIVTSVGITYENGAVVSTSFTTNLEGDIVAMTCKELRDRLENADKVIREKQRVELPKYSYPSSVLSMAMLGDWAKLGIDFQVERKDCVRIGGLDSQRESGKAIFGGGLLLSERARIEAERAKPRTVWELSERELEIIRSLG